MQMGILLRLVVLIQLPIIFSGRWYIPLVATSTRSSQPLTGQLHCQTKRWYTYENPHCHVFGSFPEQYKVLVRSPFLFVDWHLISYIANVLGVKEHSRIGIIQTLWNYIKLQGLQDKVDRRVIRADERLRPVSIFSFQVFLSISMAFFQQDFRRRDHQLPDIVNWYLVAPDPIILHYLINPSVPLAERPSTWDGEVRTEDFALKHRMAVTVATSKESAQTLVKIDEEVSVNSLLRDQ